jgi:hypothetical protein
MRRIDRRIEMSVHQVEEYYTHFDISGATDLDRERIRVLLVENNWDDFEFTDTDLNVDGFESEMDARNCDELVREYLDT